MSTGNGDPEIPPEPDVEEIDLRAKIAEVKAVLAESDQARKQEAKQASEQVRANNEAANRAIEALRAGEPLQDEEI